MLKKNDLVEVIIEDMGSDGEGVSHVDGYTLFVKDTAVGDQIVAKVVKTLKNYGYARCEKIIKKSPHRIEPFCPVSKTCGGCKLCHISYEEELRFKEEKVLNCITRIANISLENVTVERIIGSPQLEHYRNKAQFPVGLMNNEVVTGFFAEHSHNIIPVDNCITQAAENTTVVRVIRDFIKEYKISIYNNGSGLVRHIVTRKGFVSKEFGICIVINGEELPHSKILVNRLREIFLNSEIVLKYVCLSINKKMTNVIMGDSIKTIYGYPYITDKIGSLNFKISPLSFFQVNPYQIYKLYDTVREFAELSGNEIVWDLYCGIGTISLFLANSSKEVYGVEIVKRAVKDAIENAKLNKIDNVFFIEGKAEEVSKNLKRPDVIVVDPPRKGCDEKLIETLLSNSPSKIVYVSCDPATMSRDLKRICHGGQYELKKLVAIDQFCRSTHVETVVLMSKVK